MLFVLNDWQKFKRLFYTVLFEKGSNFKQLIYKVVSYLNRSSISEISFIRQVAQRETTTSDGPVTTGCCLNVRIEALTQGILFEEYG